MGSKYRNETIKIFLKQDEITKTNYKLLFEDKNEYTEDQDALFDEALREIIDLQSDNEIIELKGIKFPSFEFKNYNFPDNVPLVFDYAIFYSKTHFEEVEFTQQISFEGATFQDKTYFRDCVFQQNVTFTSATFLEKVYFRRTKFMGSAFFSSTTFMQKADFRDVLFMSKTLFRGAVSKDLIQFSGAQIDSLDLETSRFDDASYLHIHGVGQHLDKPILLTSKNFPNKESARHIKAHFEKQNNITEANKYFVIEQSLYLDELKSEDRWSHKGRIFTVALHKLISNSGTSWIKVLFWILLFALIVYLFYYGIPQTKEDILSMPNKAIDLINPLNIFKRGYNLYDGHAFWAMIVRLISTYLIYQFMMAFRQDTRRK